MVKVVGLEPTPHVLLRRSFSSMIHFQIKMQMITNLVCGCATASKGSALCSLNPYRGIYALFLRRPNRESTATFTGSFRIVLRLQITTLFSWLDGQEQNLRGGWWICTTLRHMSVLRNYFPQRGGGLLPLMGQLTQAGHRSSCASRRRQSARHPWQAGSAGR